MGKVQKVRGKTKRRYMNISDRTLSHLLTNNQHLTDLGIGEPSTWLLLVVVAGKIKEEPRLSIILKPPPLSATCELFLCSCFEMATQQNGDQPPPPYKVHYYQQVTKLPPPAKDMTAVAVINCHEAAKKYKGMLFVAPPPPGKDMTAMSVINCYEAAKKYNGMLFVDGLRH